MSENEILSKLRKVNLELDKPILLFEKEDQSIYWLGTAEDNAFRVNTYLINDGDQSLIVDPGSRSYFEKIKANVKSLGYLDNLDAMILSHQDPDVAASMFDWLKIKPKMKVICTPRTHILLPHYGISDYDYYDTGVINNSEFKLNSGRSLKFIDAPFLHFPGAMATFHDGANYLFSGDIWAAIDVDYQFIVKDFMDHRLKLDLFHIDYMASNIASRGFAEKLSDFEVNMILPQHGSIIPPEFVNDAIDYLKDLRCGLDLVYPGKEIL